MCGPDSGDEGVPVSIHVTNNISAAPVDPANASAEAHGAAGQTDVNKIQTLNKTLKPHYTL